MVVRVVKLLELTSIMSRKKIIASNWKLNMNQAETKQFLAALAPKLKTEDLQEIEVVICPTFTSLAAAKEAIKNSNIILAAQDVSQYQSGAYTGEISAAMLQEIGVSSVLVGHSERRESFKEDDAVINAKLKTALAAGLKVILCCGESDSTREAGKTDAWVTGQIESALNGVPAESLVNIVIAYEPIWAIGTGKTCESAEANRVIKVIRNQVAKLAGQEQAQKLRILYGGSVKASTIEETVKESDIDGCLVGGASIKVDEISAIISVTAQSSRLTAHS